MVTQLIEIIGFIEVENWVDGFAKSAIISGHIRDKQQTARSKRTLARGFETEYSFIFIKRTAVTYGRKLSIQFAGQTGIRDKLYR